MIRIRLSALAVYCFILPSFTVLALGKRQVDNKCFTTSGKQGRCVRLDQCTELVALTNRAVIYTFEVELITAAFGACGSDENSMDPIVCCDSLPDVSPITTTTASPEDHLKDVLPKICGVSTKNESSIFPATNETSNFHAWAVYLEIQNLNSDPTRCVGTLIQESFVLTAAHCIHDLPLENIKLYFGNVSIDNLSRCLMNGDCQERRAQKFTIHNDYNHTAHMNDIALIKLRQPIEFTEHIAPACLPLSYKLEENLSNETRLLSVGWGRTIGGRFSDTKRVVILKPMQQDQCVTELRKRPKFNTTMIFSVMCTVGQIEGQDVCSGDSGAPLLHLHDGMYHVVGVVSFGPKCGGEIHSTVSARVEEYIQWILNHLIKDKLLKDFDDN